MHVSHIDMIMTTEPEDDFYYKFLEKRGHYAEAEALLVEAVRVNWEDPQEFHYLPDLDEGLASHIRIGGTRTLRCEEDGIGAARDVLTRAAKRIYKEKRARALRRQ